MSTRPKPPPAAGTAQHAVTADPMLAGGQAARGLLQQIAIAQAELPAGSLPDYFQGLLAAMYGAAEYHLGHASARSLVVELCALPPIRPQCGGTH